MLLVQGKSWCRGYSGADSPEDLRGMLPPRLMTGMLGSEGLLTRFLKAVPELFSLHAFLVVQELEPAPLRGGRPKPAETEKDFVSGEY